DERVVARGGGRQLRRIADVTLDHAKVDIVLRQKGVAEEHRIVDRDLVALIEQLRHQQASAIARATRHENPVEEFIHGNAHYLVPRITNWYCCPSFETATSWPPQ